ncbi:MAG: metallophosphoesterase, partial [Solibacillus sp.]
TYVEKEMDYVFTGHAHGGQIRLPFIGGLVAPSQGVLPKYTAGIFEENNTTMVISRGLGNSIFPYRIFNLPQIITVELQQK